jgi:hypothetical protein
VAHADAPVVRCCAELAAQHKLWLHAHVDDVAVDKLLTLYPGIKILWAHAGMSASATTVGQLLDRFPMLWVELALRSDVAPGGTLDPAWRAVFLKHPERFMGSSALLMKYGRLLLTPRAGNNDDEVSHLAFRLQPDLCPCRNTVRASLAFEEFHDRSAPHTVPCARAGVEPR